MPRTVRAFQHFVEHLEGELSRIWRWIYLRFARCKKDRNSYIFYKLGIAEEIARIGTEVVRIIKLRRIHKVADHHHVVLCYSTFYKRDMPRMKRTHRGDKPNGTREHSIRL